MIFLFQYLKFITTECGGLRKRIYLAIKYCIILREERKLTGMAEIGLNILLGHFRSLIQNKYKYLINSEESFIEKFYRKRDTCYLILKPSLPIKADK